MKTLSEHAVRGIYDHLVLFSMDDLEDPIDPVGIKSHDLLSSAVGRQFTGLGDNLKYGEPRANAAALFYGLCNNHPFHNGNKRTALVSCLVHLEENGLIPRQEVTFKNFEDLVKATAGHWLPELDSIAKIVRKDAVLHKSLALNRITADQEVLLITEWLKRNTRPVDKRERPLTFRQLRKILCRFECEFEDPKKNFIKIRRVVSVRKSFLGVYYPTTAVLTKALSYPSEHFQLTPNSIREIRQELQLTENDGVDSRTFYDFDGTVDSLLCQYRGLLKRLART